MALFKNRSMHPNYCYACDSIHEGNCWPEKSEGAKIAEIEMANAVETYKIVGIEKALAPSVFEKEVWNAAIEAAAKHCDEMGEEARISENIRGLKKC